MLTKILVLSLALIPSIAAFQYSRISRESCRHSTVSIVHSKSDALSAHASDRTLPDDTSTTNNKRGGRRIKKAAVWKPTIFDPESENMLTKSEMEPNVFWTRYCQALEDYHRIHGNINIPPSYKHEQQEELTKRKPLKLDCFIMWLRRLWQDGKADTTVPPHVMQKLDDLGMLWDPIFQKRVEEWIHQNATASLDMSTRWWVSKQTAAYRRMQAGILSTTDVKLTPERIQKLRHLGVLSLPPSIFSRQYRWDQEWSNNLEEWKKGSNQAKVLLWSTEIWRMHDNAEKTNKTKAKSTTWQLPMILTEARRKSLEAANFFERPRPTLPMTPPEVDVAKANLQWKQILSSLKRFWSKHRHANVPYDTNQKVGGISLFSICQRLKHEYRMIRAGQYLDGFLMKTKYVPILGRFGLFSHETIRVDEVLRQEIDWWMHFHDLGRLKETTGTYYMGDNPDSVLAKWMAQQQVKFKNLGQVHEPNVLKETHFRALGKIGFRVPRIRGNRRKRKGIPDKLVHRDNVDEDIWLQRYHEMESFIQEHGHSEVINNDGLAFWAYNQRLLHERNRTTRYKTTLTKRRTTMLLGIGFDFRCASPAVMDDWDGMVESLKAFRSMHGHCCVPMSLPSSPSLGDWLHRQRMQHKNRQKDSQDNDDDLGRVEQLKAVGVDFDMDNLSYFRLAFDALWKERLLELEAFKQQNGHCNPPSTADDILSPSHGLFVWANEQRNLYRISKERGYLASHLKRGQIRELDRLGFVWEP